MAKLRELKTLILCIFFVALASLIAMFSYTVNIARYMKSGRAPVVLLINDTQWNSHLQEMSFSGSKDQRWSNELTYHSTAESVGRNRAQREQNNHQNRSNINVRIPNYDLATENRRKYIKGLCPPKSPALVGRLRVDKSVPKMEDTERKMSRDFRGWVDKGGQWKPTECKARVKMALIIPYRNRFQQLSIFVRHMHPILKRQNLDYRIFVIEQSGDTSFNRGMLLNVGFKEALRFNNYKCFIFHDVDLMPENDRNKYSCPTSPRHLSVAVDTFNYRLPYEQIFGGAGSFSREHFELINGFSNKFWGWGGEDDDLYNRISARGLELTRPSIRLGRYKMIKKFHKTSEEDSNRFDKLMHSAQRMDNDGLNSLKYAVENLTEYRLYTLVTVDVKAMFQDQAESFLQDESTSGFFYDITTESNGDMTDKYDELFTIY